MFNRPSTYLILLSFVLFASYTSTRAINTVDNALSEYEEAARSCDLEQYKKACKNLIEIAKNSALNDIELCWKTACDVTPNHSHSNRFYAYMCSLSLVPLLNTCVHGLSTRGDSKYCTATTSMARGQAYILTTLAAILGCGTVATGTVALVKQNFELGVATGICALYTALLSTLAGLDWANLHFNTIASDEKTKFDDTHKSLIRSLTVLKNASMPQVPLIQNSFTVEL